MRTGHFSAVDGKPLVVALAAAGPSVAAPTTGRLDVTLGSPGEYSVTPSATSVAAGKIAVSVTNRGKITHELNIIRIASAPAG